MNSPNIDRLLRSVDLDEVKPSDAFVERTWTEIRPIAEGQRPISELDDDWREPHELVHVDFGEPDSAGATSSRWRASVMLIAAAAALVVAFVLSTQPDEVQSVDSRLVDASQSCLVLAEQIDQLLDGEPLAPGPEGAVRALDTNDLAALAALFSDFLDSTNPTSLDEQFRQMRIIQRGLGVAVAHRSAGDEAAAAGAIDAALGNILVDNDWHRSGALEACFGD